MLLKLQFKYIFTRNCRSHCGVEPPCGLLHSSDHGYHSSYCSSNVSSSFKPSCVNSHSLWSLSSPDVSVDTHQEVRGGHTTTNEEFDNEHSLFCLFFVFFLPMAATNFGICVVMFIFFNYFLADFFQYFVQK